MDSPIVLGIRVSDSEILWEERENWRFGKQLGKKMKMKIEEMVTTILRYLEFLEKKEGIIYNHAIVAGTVLGMTK